jgi:hypothetical protein
MSGRKVILTDRLLPAGMIIGNDKPLAVKTPPVKFAAETVTDLVPAFESVTDWLTTLLTETFPNDRLVGEIDNS